MSKNDIFKFFAKTALVLLISLFVASAHSSDSFAAMAAYNVWATGGVTVFAETARQYEPSMLSDGAGGFLLFWADERGGPTSAALYGQRYNPLGQPQWTTGGDLIDSTYGQNLSLATDGSGNAYLTWLDSRGGGQDGVYAQKFDPLGNSAWGQNGLLICPSIVEPDIAYPGYYFASSPSSPSTAPDGSGGAYIAWRDDRSQSYYNIYAQKVENGSTVWQSDGITVETGPLANSFTSMISAGSGSAIVEWANDNGNGTYSLYAAKLATQNNSPYLPWTTNGVTICSTVLSVFPDIVSDGAGGMITAWNDNRNGSTDIYGQRIDSSGTIQWGPSGRLIESSSGYLSNFVSDGNGGALLEWDVITNFTTTGECSIYAQHVDSTGSSLWTGTGVPVASFPYLYVRSPYGQYYSIWPDGNGGAVVTWLNGINGGYNVYEKDVDSTGATLWADNGLTCTTTASVVSASEFVYLNDGNSGAFIAWRDDRNNPVTILPNVYVQRLSHFLAGGPLITDIKFNGRPYLQGGIISSKPVITAVITSELGRTGMDTSYKYAVIDPGLSNAVSISGSYPQDVTYWIGPDTPANGYQLTVTVEAPISAQPVKGHTISLGVKSMLGDISTWNGVVSVMSGSVQVVGKVLNYPNPFKPLSTDPSQNTTTIMYTLSVDAPITMIIYDVTGHEVHRQSYNRGSQGGKAGINQITWNGRSLFNQPVGNGMYVFKVISDDKVISSAKLVVLD